VSASVANLMNVGDRCDDGADDIDDLRLKGVHRDVRAANQAGRATAR
jgi:hypothetical protein